MPRTLGRFHVRLAAASPVPPRALRAVVVTLPNQQLITQHGYCLHSIRISAWLSTTRNCISLVVPTYDAEKTLASETKVKEQTAGKNAGVGVTGIQSSQVYAENVVYQARQGHGFAAEKANHKIDILSGKDAKIVGGDNAKNGADRLVDGVTIQTKYCNGGGKCISECFDPGGQFKYLKADGTPMQIEVPSDMYESAIQSMQEKIRQGRVPGVEDPNKARKIIRQGKVTYEQAKNVAKFGTVEGITYDAANGVQVAAGAGSLSAAVTFALSVWRGEDAGTALELACYSGLSVGGVAFVTTIATAQVSRTSIEHTLQPASDWVVKKLGSKSARWISNNLSSVYGGADLVGGAAKNHVSKLLRGNVVTAAVTTLVLSTGDFVRLFHGRISGAQAFKNIASTGASVAGGVSGAAAAGAALGSVIPGPGTVAGFVVGAIGGVIGGALAGKAASTVLDGFIEDDAKQMLEIVNEVFGDLAGDYLLSEEEANQAISGLERLDLVERLRDMYASNNRHVFAADLLRPLIENEVKKRPPVQLPSPDQFMAGIKKMVDATMAEEARERRARLMGRVGRTLRWGMVIGLIAFGVNKCQQYQAEKPIEAQPSQIVAPAASEPVSAPSVLANPQPLLNQPVAVEAPPAPPAQTAFPKVSPEVAYRELYGEQPPVVLSQYILKGTPIPFIRGVYPFSGTQGRNYLVALGVSKSEKDNQLYIDALIYKKVDGGWTPQGKGYQLLAVVNERIPTGQLTPVETVVAEAGLVTLGLRLDHFTKAGQSSSAMMKLLRFSEDDEKLYMLKPTTTKSSDDGELMMPHAAVIGGKPGYVFEEKNPRFQAQRFFFDDSVSYVCDVVKDPDTKEIRQDTCKDKNIVISR